MDYSFEDMKSRLNISENERYELKRALRHAIEHLENWRFEMEALHESLNGSLDGSLADLRVKENMREATAEERRRLAESAREEARRLEAEATQMEDE